MTQKLDLTDFRASFPGNSRLGHVISAARISTRKGVSLDAEGYKGMQMERARESSPINWKKLKLENERLKVQNMDLEERNTQMDQEIISLSDVQESFVRNEGQVLFLDEPFMAQLYRNFGRERIPHKEIESCPKAVHSKSITPEKETLPTPAIPSSPSIILKGSSKDATILPPPSEKALPAREGSSGFNILVLQRSSQKLHEKLSERTKSFKTSTTAIKGTLEILRDELDCMEENLRSLQSTNNDLLQLFLDEHCKLLNKISDMEEQRRKEETEFENQKPENTALQERNTLKDQEIQTDESYESIELEKAELQLELNQKEERIHEIEDKIRKSIIDASKAKVDQRDHMITLEKETIAAEALSALHQTVIHDKPKKVIFADNPDCAVNEVLEFDVKSRANSCTSCNSFESSEREEARKKFQKVQRPQKRSVRVAYFRWTTDKNLLLVSKMIEVLAEYGKNQLKESDFLHMVWERCEEICSESKIRDNVNNLLRRHLHLSTKSIPEVKSCPEEYARLLEKIRKSLANQGSEREKVKEQATTDGETGKTLNIPVSRLEEGTSSEKWSEQTVPIRRSISVS